jgi:hypothetical protein
MTPFTSVRLPVGFAGLAARRLVVRVVAASFVADFGVLLFEAAGRHR